MGGGAGDAAVEFLDVREAALVSVAEALARKALPWQAQLCPRALQDLEVARVRVRGKGDGAQQDWGGERETGKWRAGPSLSHSRPRTARVWHWA